MLEDKLNHKINSYEDAITSTIIGLLKYLPTELFWEILSRSCTDSTNLPNVSGELKAIDFWPKWCAKETCNSKYVEPDVFIRFACFDVIIEIKPYDDLGQHQIQWENQITSYHNEKGECDKQLYYISLGGNYLKSNQSIIYNDNEFIINKCNWIGVLLEVSNLLKELRGLKTIILNKDSTIRILEDIIRGFNYYGFYNISWFEEMKMYTIEQ